MMNCVYNKGPHALVDVTTTPEDSYGQKNVVRWCQNCGAIVTDREADGRNYPGLVPMRFPRIAYDAANRLMKVTT